VEVPAGIDSATVEGKAARVLRSKAARACTLKVPAGADVTVKVSYTP
jgi:hypothetical protein